jgi:hypothetical protein
MTGYVFALAPCLVCRRTFPFNPMRVPSLDIGHGREPICETCMAEANRRRAALGQPLHPILPGAYDVASEAELGD